MKCNASISGKSNSQNVLIRAVRNTCKDLTAWGEGLFPRHHNGKSFFRKICSIMLFLIKNRYYFQRKHTQNGHNFQNLLPQNAVSLGYWTAEIISTKNSSKQFLSLHYLKLTSHSIWYFEVNFYLLSSLVLQKIFCQPHLSSPPAGFGLLVRRLLSASNDPLSLMLAPKDVRDGPIDVALSH